MHDQAMQWVRTHAPADPGSVLDVGGRNINGTAADCFKDATLYRTLDILPGDGVDIVADAATWTADRAYDVVVCCEVFEHAEQWRAILRTIYAALRPGGLAILTMAGPGRPAHSGVDGEWRLLDGEHYGNVDPGALERELKAAGFTDIVVDYQPSPADTRAVATKP
jgi:SAM-dependent methyltransferase